VEIQPKLHANNGRLALMLSDLEDRQPVAMITLNCPEIKLGPTELVVKSYAENEGMAEFLLKNKLIRNNGTRTDGYPEGARIVEMTEKLSSLIDQTRLKDPYCVHGKVRGKLATG
jgi:hypothetical protein